MVRRAAYALSAALCCAALGATSASADVTYTWENLSSGHSPFGLSFTVSSAVTIAANSGFAGYVQGAEGPDPQVAYPFPSQLVSLDGYAAFAHLTPGSFLSPLNANQSGYLDGNEPDQPVWSFNLVADTATQTASLELGYAGDGAAVGNPSDANPPLEFCPVGDGRCPALLSTNQVTTFDVIMDGGGSTSVTGKLVASTAVPEPRSLWVLMAGLGMLWLVSRAGARQSKT